MTEVVRQALRERVAREESRRPDPVILERLLEISDRCAARPVLDMRSDDEIAGYDERGGFPALTYRSSSSSRAGLRLPRRAPAR